VSAQETPFTLHVVGLFTVAMSSEEKIQAIADLLLDKAAPSTTTK
jgi:hypothetical protein